MKKLISVLLALVLLLGAGLAAAEEARLPELPEGVRPVTWEVTPEHLMIETDEARALYERIVAGDYPSVEELKAHPVVAQLDALSAYYKALYGNTLDIDTPERDQLRREKKEWFLARGSARTESIDGNGRHKYVYDGELKKEYRMELVLGLPAFASPISAPVMIRKASELRSPRFVSAMRAMRIGLPLISRAFGSLTVSSTAVFATTACSWLLTSPTFSLISALISFSSPSSSGAVMLLLQVYRPVSMLPSSALIRSQPIPAIFVPQAWRITVSPFLFFMMTFSVSWLCPSSMASIPAVCSSTGWAFFCIQEAFSVI